MKFLEKFTQEDRNADVLLLIASVLLMAVGFVGAVFMVAKDILG